MAYVKRWMTIGCIASLCFGSVFKRRRRRERRAQRAHEADRYHYVNVSGFKGMGDFVGKPDKWGLIRSCVKHAPTTERTALPLDEAQVYLGMCNVCKVSFNCHVQTHYLILSSLCSAYECCLLLLLVCC